MKHRRRIGEQELRLARVHLGQDVVADVEEFRRARPDVRIVYFPPKPGPPAERVGEIAIHPPHGAVKEWWIFEDLAGDFGTETNYAAERQVRKAIKKVHPDLLPRLSFDTEAGGVSLSAESEEDIRRAAEILNGLVRDDKRTP